MPIKHLFHSEKSDGSDPTLVRASNWNAAHTPGINEVPYSATPVFDASLGDIQIITLTGNVTSSTLINAVQGQNISFFISQDAVGGRTFAWPSNVKGARDIKTGPSEETLEGFIFDGTNAYAPASWEPSEAEWAAAMYVLIADYRRNNYIIARALDIPYQDENLQSVALAAGERKIHALFIAGSWLWGSSRLNPAKLFRFNPDNLTEYSVLTFPDDAKHRYADDAVYIKSKDRIYVVFGNTDRTLISEVNPDTLAWTDVVEDLDQGTTFSDGGQSMDSDGNYLYVITMRTPAKVLKYSLVSFAKSLQATLTLNNGHAIRYDGTNLYATGTGTTPGTSPGWVIRMNPADLTYVSQQFAAGDTNPTDDFALVGEHLFICLENANGIMLRIQKSDLSSINRLYNGIPRTGYGLFYDGRHIWSCYAGTPGTLVRTDPLTFEMVPYEFPPGTDFGGPNEITTDGKRLFVSFWDMDGGPTTPGRVARIAMAGPRGAWSPSIIYPDTQGKRRFQLDYLGNIKTDKKVTTYNGDTAVGNGLASVLALDDKVAQSASIGSTTLFTNGAVADYFCRVSLILACTVADASGATVTATIGWKGDGIARILVSASVALASTENFAVLNLPGYLSMGEAITYLTTVTGTPATGRYSVHVRVERLS